MSSPPRSSPSSMNMDFSHEEDLFPFLEIDENGLPFPSSDDEDSTGEAAESGTTLPATDLYSHISDFALDFYNGGTDWSHLMRGQRVVIVQKGVKKHSLVQKDLFQVWGMRKSSMGPGLGVPSRPRKKRQLENSDAQTCWASSRETNGESDACLLSRACPFYKKIPGTSFSVDAFRYGAIKGCSAYFLSHFHCDHYGGLSKRWSHGPIYCTPITARLVNVCLAVNPQYICPLELDTECIIDGIKVTLLEANHCPGAALIHFRLKDGKCYLHTGDFRASQSMQHYPLLANQHINVLYLDTTYCNPEYSFPAKAEVLDFVVRTTRKFLSLQPDSLVVVGAYSIGKEPVYLAISQALGVPIYTNASRRKILQSFGWPELSGKLCLSTESSPLHVLPISFLRHENLTAYLKTCKQQFKSALAFRPTGWTYCERTGSHLDLIKPTIKGNITIYGVPYSEHSSFTELREFVRFLKPDKIIPTVNAGNAASRVKMQSYFREWLQ